MRKIRVAQQAEAPKRKVANEVSQERPVNDMLLISPEALAETITAQELTDLINEGLTLAAYGKEKTAIVKQMKDRLKATAKEQGWKAKETALGKVRIDADTSLTVTVDALATLLKKMDKRELFKDLVSVRISEATKYLGRETLKVIGTEESEEFGKVVLQAKK
jgi:hypothetical protein